MSTTNGFEPGLAEPLFESPALDVRFPHPSYAVSADSQKFLLIESPEDRGERKIRVVQNWYEEFRDRERD